MFSAVNPIDRRCFFQLFPVCKYHQHHISKGIIRLFCHQSALLHFPFYSVFQGFKTDAFLPEVRTLKEDQHFPRLQVLLHSLQKTIFFLCHKEHVRPSTVIVRFSLHLQNISLPVSPNSHIRVIQFQLEFHSAACRQGGGLLLQHLLVHPVISKEINLEIPDKISPHNGVHSQVQRHRTDHGDNHHGGKYTDIGQAGGILFHTVEHAGNGHKILLTVIDFFPLFKEAQHRNTAGSKQKICAHNHQKHRQEKVQKDIGVQLGFQCQTIAHKQCRSSCQAPQTNPSGLFLPSFGVAHQLNRV